MDRYTDLDYYRDAAGHYDLVIDEDNRDLAVIDGLESAILISFFSDRRAAEDEVTDPMKRRGWIGDLVSEVPGDKHGSGLWLYEQSRLTGETRIGLRLEAEAALRWMTDESLIRAASAEVGTDPSERTAMLVATTKNVDGSVNRRAYELAIKTLRRRIAQTF